MTIDASMESMFEIFVYETTTLLEQLDEIVLNSEKVNGFKEESINEIFRIMHTIKGSSAMMGLSGVASLAHAVEDVFFIIRDKPQKQEMIKGSIFDLLFQALDFLKIEIISAQTPCKSDQDADELISQLKAQCKIMKSATASSNQNIAKTDNLIKNKALWQSSDKGDFYRVKVTFEDGCQMENIRAFMLLYQIAPLCSEIDSIPENPHNDASLCDEIIKNGLLLIFKPAQSVSVDEIYESIKSSVNIKSCEPIECSCSRQAAVYAQKNRQSFISVNQAKLDRLMDLVGELITAQAAVINNPDLKNLKLDNFNRSAHDLEKLTGELQNVVMSMRIVPMSAIFQKMNRTVRDMAKKLDKKVELVTFGDETEIDKAASEAISDSLMHMVRNAIDHAIENTEARKKLGKPEIATVNLSAKSVDGNIVITVSDDGRGLDFEKILEKAKIKCMLTKPESEYTDKEIFNLVMLPGLSTNQTVTEFSGRGVGLDVVRKNLEKVGGSVSIESIKNKGTTFTIKFPFTVHEWR